VPCSSDGLKQPHSLQERHTRRTAVRQASMRIWSLVLLLAVRRCLESSAYHLTLCVPAKRAVSNPVTNARMPLHYKLLLA
jgi:hypothetical protein